MNKKVIYSVLLILLLITVSQYHSKIVTFISEVILHSSNNKIKSIKNELIQERSHLRYKNFTIYYSKDDQTLIPYTENALKRAVQINNTLNISPKSLPSLDVIIINNKKSFQNFSELEHTSAVYDANLKTIAVLPVMTEGQVNTWKFDIDIVHEYTHAALMEKASELKIPYNEFPLWFSEGISAYTSYSNEGIDFNITDLQSPFVPLNKITENNQWDEFRGNKKYDIYFQSFITIKYLTKEYGPNIFTNILNEMKKENDFNRGFAKATGINIKTLENKVKNYK